MIEKEIYCYVNGFLEWNISKKTSYIVIEQEFFGKICILNLRNKKLKIKEALHINWRKPNLIGKQNHLALTLSL